MSLTSKDITRLRKFGLLFFVVFGLISLYKIYRGKQYLVFASISLVFFVLGIAFPRLLVWPEKIWMKFGDFMSSIMTRVMVSILFFLAITPVGVIMRLFGKNPLKLSFDKDAKSYWEPFAKDGPGSRPFSPF